MIQLFDRITQMSSRKKEIALSGSASEFAAAIIGNLIQNWFSSISAG
ncbi:hypothetical protein ACFC06_21690 [Nocardia sp. NPDC056064]